MSNENDPNEESVFDSVLGWIGNKYDAFRDTLCENDWMHDWGEWTPSESRDKQIFIVNRIRAINQILQGYTKEEIKELSSHLQINYEKLEGETKESKIKDLILDFCLTNRFDELLDAFSVIIQVDSSDMKIRVEKIKDELSGGGLKLKDLNFDWEFDSKQSCFNKRKCVRCSQIESREEHIWGRGDYIREHSCEKVRYCRSCGKSGEVYRGKHEWGDWKYESPNECDMHRKCERCNEQDKSRRNHNWHEKRDRREPCKIIKYCTRCGEKKIVGYEHNWKTHPKNRNSCTQKEYCTYCKKERVLKKDHSWGPWVPMIGKQHSSERICNKCGQREARLN